MWDSESNISPSDFLNILIGIGIANDMFTLTDQNLSFQVLYIIVETLSTTSIENMEACMAKIQQLSYAADNCDILDCLCSNSQVDYEFICLFVDIGFVPYFSKQWFQILQENREITLRFVKKDDIESYTLFQPVTHNIKLMSGYVMKTHNNTLIYSEKQTSYCRTPRQYVIYHKSFMELEVTDIPQMNHGYVNTNADRIPNNIDEYELIQIRSLDTLIYDRRIANAWNLSPSGDAVKEAEQHFNNNCSLEKLSIKKRSLIETAS